MINRLKRSLTDFLNRNKSNQEIFSKIYQKNQWGGDSNGSFFSGEGTYVQDLDKYIQVVTDYIQKNNIQSVVEIGCGDFHVAKKIVEQTNIKYTGIDVVPELISHLESTYGSEKISFLCLDASANNVTIPRADLCIIRQVLQHLNNESILKILKNTSHIPKLLITEHLPLQAQELNADKPTNGYIRLQNKIPSGIYLDKAPFNKNLKEELLRIRLDDKNYNGELVHAQLVTQCFEN